MVRAQQQGLEKMIIIIGNWHVVIIVVENSTDT